jgi:tape measure domain-containing protein
VAEQELSIIIRARDLATAAIARVRQAARGLGGGFTGAAQESAKATGQLRQGLRSISDQLEATRRSAVRLVQVLGGFAVIRNIFNTAAEFQSLRASMRAVTGSADAAEAALAFVRSEAERLRIPLAVATRNFVQLTAAARGTALEGAGTRQIFTALSEAGLVLGLSGEDLAGTMRAVQQIMSKGVVSAEELRQQLGDRLFGAFQIAARSVNLTTAELNKLIASGELASDAFLLRFAEQIRKEFGKDVPAATRTARAALVEFQNALTDLKLAFAESGFLDALSDTFRELGKTLKDPDVRAGAEVLGKNLGDLIRLIGQHSTEIDNFLGGLIGLSVGGATADQLAKLAKHPLLQLAIKGGGRLGGAAAGFALADRLIPDAPRTVSDVERIGRSIELLRMQLEQLRRGVELRTIKPERAAAAIAQIETRIAELQARREALEAKAGTAGGPPGELPPLVTPDLAEEAKRRTKLVEAEAEAQFAVLRDALTREQQALDAQLEQNAVSTRRFYEERTRIAQAQIDAEIDAKRRQLEEERRLVAAAADEDDRVAALGRIAKLESEITVLSRNRLQVELDAVTALTIAEREHADELAHVRDRLLDLTGTATTADRRAAVEREFRDLIKRLRAEGDQAGLDVVTRLINVEAARAEFGALERDFVQSLERMRAAEDALRIQREAGLLTEAQLRERVLELHGRTALEVEGLIPELERLAKSIGPEAVNAVEQYKNQLASVKLVVDEVAQRINGAFQDALSDLFTDVTTGAKSAKEAFLDFADSVLKAINRILAEKFAEKLLGSLFEGGGGGSGGIGGFVSKLFNLKHAGGLVETAAPRVRLPALAFAGAPRLHDGGVLGLRPDEIPIIARRGEEVLTEDDPRHVRNRGAGVNVQMTVMTPDAGSFLRSKGQIAAELQIALSRARRNL